MINKVTGSLLLRYNYLQLAEKYFEDAFIISQKLKNRFAEAENTNSLGVLWAKKGDHVKAEMLFIKALLIGQKENSSEMMTASYLKLSTLRSRQNRNDDSYKFCLKADSVNRKYHSHFFESELINNKAIVFAIRGDLDKALALFKDSYAISIREKKKLEQVLALQNIGLVYKEKKDYVKAVDYLNRGLTLAKSSGFKDEELRLCVNIPIILVEKKEFKRAEVKFLNLLSSAKGEGLDDLVLEIYFHLINLAKLQNEYKKAFDYLTSSKAIKDKQINEQKENALREASVTLGLYNANKKLVENENFLFQKNRERNILFGILVFVGVLLSFLVFVLLRLRRLNNKLNIKRKQLTESNAVKDKLFSIIGHDLRGNQGTTLGILNLIKEGQLNKEESELYLGMLIRQSQSALVTLDDLMLWGRAQIKGDVHQKTNFRILPMVQNVFDLNSEAIHEKKLSVTAVELEHVKVFTDSGHFSFVIRNLVANAIKFTPNGGNIKVYSAHHTKYLIKVCVVDDGMGMKDGELEAVFSPGHISKEGTNSEAGTGLGLILCKEFVEANGGKIWAERNGEGGTTICFTCIKG